MIKQWDFVLFEGKVWMVHGLHKGKATLSIPDVESRYGVDVSLLEKVSFSEYEFSDPYPEE